MNSPATSTYLPPLEVNHEREGVGEELQATLHELIDLSLIGKQLHWAVVGHAFRPVHEQLDELVASWRDLADVVAERAVALALRRRAAVPRRLVPVPQNAQLRAFRRAADQLADQLADLDIRVFALSVDDEATTRQTIAKHGLEFPVGHDADADAVAAVTGAFVNDAPRYLQSTGFVLDPEGRVIVSVYSSGAIGRLVPEDVIGLIKFVREHEAEEQAA